jgi:DNA-binding NtrC family response regulator
MQPLRVIVVNDELNTCSFLQRAFAAEGHDCKAFLRPDKAEEYLASGEADVALVDVRVGAENGIELLHRLRAMKPKLYPVIIQGYDNAEAVILQGTVDCVSKPLTVEQIRAVCERARDPSPQNYQPLRESYPGLQDPTIIGSSPKMLAIQDTIWRVAASNVNVLITGASGTGKELVARAIHTRSKRAHHPFTAVNCGSLTESILESELFGHEKGAFTGANTTHKGLVEATDGGTLFLDEFTETSLGFQVALLRVIQEQQVRRVGSSKYIPVDVRILAASNRDVPMLIRQREFREDLYYRVAVIHIAVPSLNERREDISLLVNYFLQQFNLKNECSVSIESDAVRLLEEMSWPGNVRELENTLNRLAIFSASLHITAAEVELEVRRAKNNGHSYNKETDVTPERLLDVERQHIIRILKRSNGNKAEAARRLGIERKTLYRKALRLGVDLS